MEQVLGWLERHIDPEQVAATTQQRQAEEAEKKQAQKPESELEKGLLGWKKRASQRVSKTEDSEAGAKGGAKEGGGGVLKKALSGRALGQATRVPQGPTQAQERQWLADLRRDVESDAPPPAESMGSVWARQATLEAEARTDAAARRRERDEARSLQKQRNQRRTRWSLGDGGGGGGGSNNGPFGFLQRGAGGATVGDDDDDDDSFGDGFSGGPKADVTVAKFLERLPTLEQNKAEAKEAVVEAEKALRKVLGRKPIEVERRDDDTWARAAMAYKEAEQALFLAKALTTWDD